MRTLQLHVTRQVLATLIMAVAVFTFILLLDNLRREILVLLINRQATLGMVIKAIALLIPFVLVFAIPLGMLCACLLVFGRFSADNELTAVRAGGVSLVSVITPVLLISLALSVLCGFFNLEFAPQCRLAYKAVLFKSGMENPTAMLSENRFIEDFPGYVVFIGKRKEDTLHDVVLYKTGADGRMESRLNAAEAVIVTDLTNRQVTLKLTGVQAVDLKQMKVAAFEEYPVTLDLKAAQEKAVEPGLAAMSFSQLQIKHRQLERQGVDVTPVLVQMHRQVAFSFACFAFTLVGIPLGIRAHRRETTFGIALAILLVVAYYSFIILGQALKAKPELLPHLIIWIPNFLFQAVGMVLLARANRN